MKALPVVAILLAAFCLAACHAPGESSGEDMRPTMGEGSGNAHVHVYLGSTHGQLFSYPNWHDSDFYINGIEVGTIGSSDYLEVDLAPGVYAFSWHQHHNYLGRIESAIDYDMLQPGQDVFLALNINRNSGGWIPPLGWWVDPDTAHLADATFGGRIAIADKHPLRPNSGVLAQLHPIAGPGTDLPPSW